MPDHYKVLGVERTASQSEIKRAYRKLALKFHPDQNAGSLAAEERFRMIADAYNLLSDEQRRRFYDRFGVEKNALVRVAAPFANRGVEGFVDSVFSELFRKRKKNNMVGRDRRYSLKLSFEESILGINKDISVPTIATCGGCGGSGAADDGQVEVCHVCDGTGEIREFNSIIPSRQECGFCQGRAKIAIRACPRCHGNGQETIEQTLTIRVPPGSEAGQRLRYRGAGEPGTGGGRDGDLYVVLDVTPDPLFERDGNDIRVKLPITIRDAALGQVVTVPTVDGLVRMKIPPGTASGKRFRIKGRGVPWVDNTKPRGDIYVEVMVETPVVETQEMREILDRWPEFEPSVHPDCCRFRDLLRQRYGEDVAEIVG
ncbi:MAG: molecular chaperone DnaJ [Myxococcales bacterium]|nr:molecular chaperone DnaJ [Myxococcales bacterium]